MRETREASFLTRRSYLVSRRSQALIFLLARYASRFTTDVAGLFEHPAGVRFCYVTRAGPRSFAVPKWFFSNLLDNDSMSQ